MAKISQADREAAAPFGGLIEQEIRDGLHDDHPFVQALARHREQATAELVEAASGLLARAFDTYRKGNGQTGSIEADDGEKCWIVHSDDIEHLRAILSRHTEPTDADLLDQVCRASAEAMKPLPFESSDAPESAGARATEPSERGE